MNVYQSRRSASFPDFVYEAIAGNSKSARVLLEGSGGVEGTRVSSPFPRPTTGVELSGITICAFAAFGWTSWKAQLR